MVIILNISSFILNAETQKCSGFSFHSLRLCVSAFLFSLLTLPLSSQHWNWIQVVSGTGEMDLTSLATDNLQNTFVSGTFTESFSLQNGVYISNGLADNYLLKLDPTGAIEWLLVGGSEGNDTDSGLCVDGENALYWVGGFWLNGQYGDIAFASTKSSKSLFFIKMNNDGEVLWTKLIEGTNAKNSGPPSTDDEENVYLTGSFSDSLFVDQQILVAQAREDLFVAKWNKEGRLIWLKRFGIEGLNRAKEVVINKKKEVVIGGSFKGKIAFPQDTIATNTPDFDVFLAALDENGVPLWIRKAGGVLEDSFSSMTLDPSNNLYVVGQYTGRLTASENIEITTEGFNENGFLLQYDSNGNPLMATSIGGTSFETATDILFHEQLFISGFFEEELGINNQQIVGTGSLSSYLLTIDGNHIATALLNVSSDNILLVNQLAKATEGSTVIGGSFKGNITFQEEYFSSTNLFSIFVGNRSFHSTTPTTISPPLSIAIFPNPADQYIQVEGSLLEYQTRLWDQQGQIVFKGKMTTYIPTHLIPNGMYFLELQGASGSAFKKVVIQH